MGSNPLRKDPMCKIIIDTGAGAPPGDIGWLFITSSLNRATFDGLVRSTAPMST